MEFSGKQGPDKPVLSAKERGKLGAMARWANREEEAAARALEILEPEEYGIERELKVIRRARNPRLLICEFHELAERRTCLVDAGRWAARFTKGMSFKMREPLSEQEYRKAWVYRGKPPRRKGRW